MLQENIQPVGHRVGCGVLQLASGVVGLGVLKAQFLHQEDLPQPMAA
jgi:hypothetical protein